MAIDLQTDLKFISRNSAKLARFIADVRINPDAAAAIAAERVRARSLKILMKHLRSAIRQNNEFNYPDLRRHLISVFNTPEIIVFTRIGVQLRRQVTRIAGNRGALMDGIEMARSSLGLGKLTSGQALEFWRERIYRPAREGLIRPRRFKKNVRGGQSGAFDYVGYGKRKYSLTIKARVQSWGALAPYWIWLDKGSEGYPSGNGTNFIDRAEEEINRLYRNEIQLVGTRYADSISREVTAFLQSPDNYEPGQFLGEITAGDRTFRLEVTPTGELGIRRD